jgi:CheY-like chemotaxis protein
MGATGGEPARRPEGAAGRVLLANGSETGRKLGSLMLGRLGYRVRVVEDAEAAVAAALGGRFDAVVLDCQMDGMGAWEAARAIRRQEREGERMLLLGLTGNEAASEVERCWEAGMDDVIAAPLTLDGLREKLSVRRGGAREPAGEYCA